MMLKIIKYPAKVLQTPSSKVSLPLSQENQKLIREMYQTVIGKGVGLAAPQVGVGLQMCIIKLDKDMVSKKVKELEFVMINPKISFYSEIQNQMVEGCLSFPGEYYKIIRPANIQVEFVGIKNFLEFVKNDQIEPILENRKLIATDWLSRVIQHEVDHLNAKLFINLGGQKIQEDDLDGNEVVD
ncbi:MAG: peptide deformylase [Flammeovirgaceae bacterium]